MKLLYLIFALCGVASATFRVDPYCAYVQTNLSYLKDHYILCEKFCYGHYKLKSLIDSNASADQLTSAELKEYKAHADNAVLNEKFDFVDVDKIKYCFRLDLD